MEVEYPRSYKVSETTKSSIMKISEEVTYAVFEVLHPGALIPPACKFKYNGMKYIVAQVSPCIDGGSIISAKKFAGEYKEDDDMIHLLDK